MRKNLTEIITIFQSVAVKPKATVVSNPATDNQQRTEESLSRPVDNLSRPVDNLSRTVDNRPRPVDNLSRPMDNRPRPMDNRMAAVDEIIREADLKKEGRVHGGRLTGDRSRASQQVNFRPVDTDTSEQSEPGGRFDALRALDKDLKRRQQRRQGGSKSTNSSHEHARTRACAEGRAQGPRSQRTSCDCVPFLERIGRRLEEDKRQILGQLVDRDRRLDTRLDSLETKTKKQIANFHQTMKETKQSYWG